MADEFEEFAHRCWFELFYGSDMVILPGHPSVKVMTTHAGGHVRILTDKGKIVAGRKVEAGRVMVDQMDWWAST